MSAIHKGITAIKDLLSIMPPSVLVSPGDAGNKIKYAKEAIQALQSLEGEAVGEVSCIPPEKCGYFGRPIATMYFMSSVKEGDKLYTAPQPPAVPDGCVQIAEAKYRYLNDHHHICETAIGVARLKLSEDDPVSAKEWLDKACEQLDGINLKLTAAQQGGSDHVRT